MELIESIEAEMKELRQLETLETQLREMAAQKRERVMALWKLALAESAKSAATAEAVSVPESAPPPVTLPKRNTNPAERPFGAPGTPRDLLAESGAKPMIENGAGATALLNGANRAPSAQQVFQSLNRLVGGNKPEPLKN